MVPLWVTRSRDRVSCHAIALPIVMSPDGHILAREILVLRTLMLTNAREIEGYDDTRELDRWTLLIGVLT